MFVSIFFVQLYRKNFVENKYIIITFVKIFIFESPQMGFFFKHVYFQISLVQDLNFVLLSELPGSKF